jgi:hypothetical protein
MWAVGRGGRSIEGDRSHTQMPSPGETHTRVESAKGEFRPDNDLEPLVG